MAVVAEADVVEVAVGAGAETDECGVWIAECGMGHGSVVTLT